MLLVGSGQIDLLPLDESDFALVDRRADCAGDSYKHGRISGYRIFSLSGDRAESPILAVTKR